MPVTGSIRGLVTVIEPCTPSGNEKFCPGAGRYRSDTVFRTLPSLSIQGTSLPLASTIVHAYHVLLALP